MGKKIVKLTLFGFMLGMLLVLLVPTLLNHRADGTVTIVSGELIARTGGATQAILVTLAVFGLYGAVCMGGTLLYDIERWPLALATAAHYLGVSAGFVIAELLLCWGLPLKALLVTELCMTLGFFLVWLILYLSYRREVRQMNKIRGEKKD